MGCCGACWCGCGGSHAVCCGGVGCCGGTAACGCCVGPSPVEGVRGSCPGASGCGYWVTAVVLPLRGRAAGVLDRPSAGGLTRCWRVAVSRLDVRRRQFPQKVGAPEIGCRVQYRPGLGSAVSTSGSGAPDGGPSDRGSPLSCSARWRLSVPTRGPFVRVLLGVGVALAAVLALIGGVAPPGSRAAARLPAGGGPPPPGAGGGPGAGGRPPARRR